MNARQRKSQLAARALVQARLPRPTPMLPAPSGRDLALSEYERKSRAIFGRPMHWILDGQTPVPTDLITWARWFEDNHGNRHVGNDFVDTPDGKIRVSTVFLGLDHNFSPAGPPLLFESLVFFADGETGDMDRYNSWNDAARGHARILAAVRELVDNVLLLTVDSLVELMFRKG